MVDEKKISLLNSAFKRIFAMPITRSTFREVQNVIVTACEQDRDSSNAIFEALLRGEAKADPKKGSNNNTGLKNLVDEFSIQIRLSKDVFDRGEFVNLITSDMIKNAEFSLFLNRIRRIDGEEFQFITDPESTVHLLRHFVTRMQELSSSDKEGKIISSFKKDLEEVRNNISALI